MAPFLINKKLLWDYNFSDKELESDSFKKWYIARVLMRGGSEDIANIGLKTIHDYLALIFIPKQTLEFWQWYFSQPDIEAKYGHIKKPAKGFSKRV